MSKYYLCVVGTNVFAASAEAAARPTEDGRPTFAVKAVIGDRKSFVIS